MDAVDTTLIQDILTQRARLYLGRGLDLDPALDRAAGDIMRHCALSLPHGERFCFRAILLGTSNRIRRNGNGPAQPGHLPAALAHAT